MKFFPRTNDLFDTVFDDMFTSPIFNARNDMVMKTDITEKDGNYMLYGTAGMPEGRYPSGTE